MRTTQIAYAALLGVVYIGIRAWFPDMTAATSWALRIAALLSLALFWWVSSRMYRR